MNSGLGRDLMSVKGLILLLAIVALGLSIFSIVKGCPDKFGDIGEMCEYNTNYQGYCGENEYCSCDTKKCKEQLKKGGGYGGIGICKAGSPPAPSGGGGSGRVPTNTMCNVPLAGIEDCKSFGKCECYDKSMGMCGLSDLGGNGNTYECNYLNGQLPTYCNNKPCKKGKCKCSNGQEGKCVLGKLGGEPRCAYITGKEIPYSKSGTSSGPSPSNSGKDNDKIIVKPNINSSVLGGGGAGTTPGKPNNPKSKGLPEWAIVSMSIGGGVLLLLVLYFLLMK